MGHWAATRRKAEAGLARVARQHASATGRRIAFSIADICKRRLRQRVQGKSNDASVVGVGWEPENIRYALRIPLHQ